MYMYKTYVHVPTDMCIWVAIKTMVPGSLT